MEEVSLYVLFGQRKGSHPGEYAPEALEVMDEFGYDDNGVWLHEKLEHYKKTESTIKRLEIIKIKIDYEQIRKIMSPNHTVTGKVDGVATNEVVK